MASESSAAGASFLDDPVEVLGATESDAIFEADMPFDEQGLDSSRMLEAQYTASRFAL